MRSQREGCRAELYIRYAGLAGHGGHVDQIIGRGVNGGVSARMTARACPPAATWYGKQRRTLAVYRGRMLRQCLREVGSDDGGGGRNIVGVASVSALLLPEPPNDAKS